jgi:hypothetical protein
MPAEGDRLSIEYVQDGRLREYPSSAYEAGRHQRAGRRGCQVPIIKILADRSPTDLDAANGARGQNKSLAAPWRSVAVLWLHRAPRNVSNCNQPAACERQLLRCAGRMVNARIGSARRGARRIWTVGQNRESARNQAAFFSFYQRHDPSRRSCRRRAAFTPLPSPDEVARRVAWQEVFRRCRGAAASRGVRNPSKRRLVRLTRPKIERREVRGGNAPRPAQKRDRRRLPTKASGCAR